MDYFDILQTYKGLTVFDENNMNVKEVTSDDLYVIFYGKNFDKDNINMSNSSNFEKEKKKKRKNLKKRKTSQKGRKVTMGTDIIEEVVKEISVENSGLEDNNAVINQISNTNSQKTANLEKISNNEEDIQKNLNLEHKSNPLTLEQNSPMSNEYIITTTEIQSSPNTPKEIITLTNIETFTNTNQDKISSENLSGKKDEIPIDGQEYADDEFSSPDQSESEEVSDSEDTRDLLTKVLCHCGHTEHLVVANDDLRMIIMKRPMLDKQFRTATTWLPIYYLSDLEEFQHKSDIRLGRTFQFDNLLPKIFKENVDNLEDQINIKFMNKVDQNNERFDQNPEWVTRKRDNECELDYKNPTFGRYNSTEIEFDYHCISRSSSAYDKSMVHSMGMNDIILQTEITEMTSSSDKNI